MIRLASWNVNSLKIRLDQVLSWLKSNQIDVLALQETKLIDELFPTKEFVERGYHVVFSGQKTYNGVAIISRHSISDVLKDNPLYVDPQRRFLAATIAGVRVINLYVPNGSEVDSEKYVYKLYWLEKVTAFIKEQLHIYPNIAVVGDFNIAPEDRDVCDPVAWQNNVLVSEKERKAFSNLLTLGFNDSFRNVDQEEKMFTWWDYRAGAFRRNQGLRIDHIVLSTALNHHCTSFYIDKTPRSFERPSDHAPVWVDLSI